MSYLTRAQVILTVTSVCSYDALLWESVILLRKSVNFLHCISAVLRMFYARLLNCYAFLLSYQCESFTLVYCICEFDCAHGSVKRFCYTFMRICYNQVLLHFTRVVCSTESLLYWCILPLGEYMSVVLLCESVMLMYCTDCDTLCTGVM